MFYSPFNDSGLDFKVFERHFVLNSLLRAETIGQRIESGGLVGMKAKMGVGIGWI